MSFIEYQEVKKPFKRKKTDSDKLSEVELTNRFDPLSDESMEEEDAPTKSTQHQNSSKAKPKKIPPIVVYGEVTKMENITKMQENMQGKINLKCKPNKTIIFTENYEDYAVVEKEILESALEYHTYTKEKDKVLKLVLKGLPTKVSINFIKEELKSNNIQAVEVKQMIKKSQENGGEETKIPVFIVTFPPNTQIKNVVQVRRLCYCVIRWEKFKNTRNVIQCYNCQAFGHISNNCHKKPKCMKCAGDHNSRDCLIKEKIKKPKCVNCDGDHVASDVSCSEYLKFLNNRHRRKYTQQGNNTNAHTQSYRQQQKTGSYRDALYNGRSDNGNSATGQQTGDFNNNQQEHNKNYTNNSNDSSGFMNDVKDIFALFKSINFAHIVNVIKEMSFRIKNENDLFSKVAIFIEGIFELLP